MIYITGDCHANWTRFGAKYFLEQRELTVKDVVIVCGDFGIWTDDKFERWWLDWLNEKPFTTLFVDGNHENFDRLYGDEFPVVDFCGGKAHQIREHVLHLMRGYVFTIGGKKFFAFGGASSHDVYDGILEPDDFESKEELMRTVREMNASGKLFRVNHLSWWKQELPSKEEMDRGIENLRAHDFKVDYVISHCFPTSVQDVFSGGSFARDVLTDYFDELLQMGLEFQVWNCGHYHDDCRSESGKYRIHYERISLLHLDVCDTDCPLEEARELYAYFGERRIPERDPDRVSYKVFLKNDEYHIWTRYNGHETVFYLCDKEDADMPWLLQDAENSVKNFAARCLITEIEEKIAEIKKR